MKILTCNLAAPGFNGVSSNNSPGGTGDSNNNDNNNDNNGNDANDPNGSGLTSGLSRQAILGISIGGSAALPILIAGIYFFCCRRQRRRRAPSSRSISATTTTTIHHHPKRRRSSDATSKASHDREPSDVSSHRRPSVARSVESNKKKEGEGGGATYLAAPPAQPASLARRSLEQYSVHIKGNATPIIIDSAAMTAARKRGEEEEAQRQLQQQQRQRQRIQTQQSGPQPKRVRFSALLRPPQRKPVPALQPQQALGGNPVTIHSGLADRRGRPALQAIRTRAAAAASSEGELAKGGGGVRVYQDRPA